MTVLWQNPSLPAGVRWQPGLITVEARQDARFIVLGDLHGCYNAVTATLAHSRFRERVRSGEDVYLVLLGDYMDRGLHAVDGILPLLFNLIREFPGRVLAMQGNHELLVPVPGGGYSPFSSPSESWDRWSRRLGKEAMDALYHIFDWLFPLIINTSHGIVFSHAGIPDDAFLDSMTGMDDVARHFGGGSDWSALDGIAGVGAAGGRARCSDPTALNLLWTDPGPEDRVPSSVDPYHTHFGTAQFSAFMDKAGASLLIRGHEAKTAGAECTYPGRLITLFSAGGKGNPHAAGSYASTTPRYLSITGTHVTAHRIPWETFRA